MNRETSRVSLQLVGLSSYAEPQDLPIEDGGSSDNEVMSNQMTRDEMAARLEAVEARLDAKVTRIEAAIENMQHEVSRYQTDVHDLQTGLRDVRDEFKTQRWWLVGSVLSVVLGVAAFNSTVLSNMVASFESGKNTAQAIAQITADQKALSEKIDAAAKSLAQAASDAKHK